MNDYYIISEKREGVALGCDTSYGKISDLHIQFMHCNGKKKKKKIVKYRAVIFFFNALENPVTFWNVFFPSFHMPSFKEWIKRHSFCSSKNDKKLKGVRFLSNHDIYYTHSSLEYDRKSSVSLDHLNEAESLNTTNEQNTEFDEQVIQNTKVNKRQGYHSIAVLVNYRANI